MADVLASVRDAFLTHTGPLGRFVGRRLQRVKVQKRAAEMAELPRPQRGVVRLNSGFFKLMQARVRDVPKGRAKKRDV